MTRITDSHLEELEARRTGREVIDPKLLEPPDIDTLEIPFQSRIIALAKACGWKAYRTHDSRRSPEGFPDIVALHRERRLLIVWECKRESVRRPTDEQRKWLDAFDAAGVHDSRVVWPSGWKRIVDVLTGRQTTVEARR